MEKKILNDKRKARTTYSSVVEVQIRAPFNPDGLLSCYASVAMWLWGIGYSKKKYHPIEQLATF